MAYTVNKTNGAVITTIADGTIDNTTDLTLIGKNYSGYGEILNENLVKLMENFASSTAPTSPLPGQLWWDTTSGLLKVYNGTSMKVISGSTASATQPSGVTTGDLWWDTTNSQLKVYNGATFTTIGPSFTAGTGTSGAIVDSVTDILTSTHVVVKLFVNEVLVGIISKDATFTPQVPIGGFTSINPGIQLTDAVGFFFHGTATNAERLDTLDSSQFLRSDANDTTSGTLGVQNDNGLTIGEDNDFKVSIAGIDARIENQKGDGDIIFRVIPSITGVPTTVMTLDGATAVASLNANPSYPDASTKVATTKFVDDNYLRRAGDGRIAGNLIPSIHNTFNLGSSALRFNYVYATSTSALYADLAECFAADQPYDPGTVVALGGAEEITAVADELSEEVFGVISTRPAYLMNAGAGDDETHPPVAMTGRVPVKVIGKVKKGDRLVSAGNGFARAAKKGEANSFNTFGRSLENKTTDGEGTVTAVVTIN